ncbi:MAG: hypothetical protein IJM08_03290 [Firmicutes bacterium]|nr:hypothetical protein [Bacillota bacterium]
MKQLIVLISTIILGIAIAFMVLGFRTTAKNLTDTTNSKVNSIVNEVQNYNTSYTAPTT